MLRTRVIPCLLLHDGGLVKTVRFDAPTYIGDPVNAIRIFNEKEVDELIFLDIRATREGRGPPLSMIADFASECFMPVGYGGGIRTVDEARAVLALGIEKVIINSAAIARPALVSELAREFGAQAVVVSIDVRKKLLGGWDVVSDGGMKKTGLKPVEHAKRMVELGAGEIFLNAVDRDGVRGGLDVPLIRAVSDAVTVPVIACGGAGTLEHLREAVVDGGASAVAAGSLFVFHGKHRAVLITYPRRDELERLLP
jgi:cyclase